MEHILNNNIDMIVLPSTLKTENVYTFIDEVIETCKDDIKNKRYIYLDGSKLEKVTIGGLRGLLKLSKYTKKVIILNLKDEIFEIFDNAGFTSFFNIYESFKQIDISNATVIGGGQNGQVYKLDDETVVKVYRQTNSLSDIIEEESIAKWAFKAGMPTAITLNVGMVNNSYAVVYEYTKAKALSHYIVNDPDNIDFYIEKYANFISEINSLNADTSFLSNKKDEYRRYVEYISDKIGEEYTNKLNKIIDDIPESHKIVHGDLHARNTRYSKEGMYVIDMGMLGYGDSIFELMALYATYIGYRLINNEFDVVKIGDDNYKIVWDKLIRHFYSELNDDELKAKENYISTLAFARILRHCYRANDSEEKITIIKDKLFKALDTI